MAKLSLSEVSKRFKISRSTLYRAIKEGRLSRGADGLFDIAEVVRCFGEPTKKQDQSNSTPPPQNDADLRQLVDFMKKEIEAYKDREKRYLDQIDRFQLLLGHKKDEEELSHDTPITHHNETPCDTIDEMVESFENKEFNNKNKSHGTPIKHINDTPRDVSVTHHETRKKRGLFGRVLNAVFNDD